MTAAMTGTRWPDAGPERAVRAGGGRVAGAGPGPSGRPEGAPAGGAPDPRTPAYACRNCGELVVYHPIMGWIHAWVGLYVCLTNPRQQGPPFLVAEPAPGTGPVPAGQ